MALIKQKKEDDKKLKQKQEKVFLTEILKFPHVSEKATELMKNNQYVFKVSKEATKKEIKKTIEEFYGVDVVSVRIINIPPKRRNFRQIEGWKREFKKAIVKVKEGQKIETLQK